jgi:ligand-binding sensor domain-containing protein
LGTLARGVKLFNRSSGEIERSWLDDAMRITAIVPGPGADFYFVTKQSGTYRLRDGETLEKLSVPRQLLDKDTQAPALHTFAARGIDERLWIGTRGLGCLIYDMNTGQWVRYSWYDGLVSDNVQALWNTDRHIWVGCYGGLNRLDKSYINRILFKNSSQREEDG